MVCSQPVYRRRNPNFERGESVLNSAGAISGAGAETAGQLAELEALERMLLVSRGVFSLSFAVCNSAALRDYLIQRLVASGEGIEVIRIPAGTLDIYGSVIGTL